MACSGAWLSFASQTLKNNHLKMSHQLQRIYAKGAVKGPLGIS